MCRRTISRRFLLPWGLFGALVLIAYGPTTAVSSDAAKPNAKTTLATTETMGGEDRYLTHVSTDKPIYKPGETLYLRGVLLHHATHAPLPEKEKFPALIEVIGPKGDMVASGMVANEDSVLGFSWKIPDSMSGGEYKAKVTYPGAGHPPAERKFDIRAYRPPRLKSQIKFVRDGYGPGDQVDATLNVTRAEGGAPAGAKVTVIARVDGQEAFRGPATVDDKGQCNARFTLPKEIRRGEGTLAMVIEDGGIVETASKTIPILLQTVDLTMYPEGGDLVAGLPNRVYFEAFTPAKKPADLAGHVLDSKGNKVAEFRSAHEGRGRFELTPKAGEKYELAIAEPAGIKSRYPLPEAKATGVVLSAITVYEPNEPITLSIAPAGTAAPAIVKISKREKVIASAAIKEFRGFGDSPLAAAAIDVPKSADGVLVATVWDAAGKPLAERLIFRKPADGVNVTITPDTARYVPGQKAKLTIKTTKDGKPVSSVVGVTVTDDSVLEMIEKRDQAPRLPVMVLLENDVKELADADVYLDPKNDKAPEAVDLLLGTQGWRRFALVNPNELMAKHGDLGRRAVALRIVPIHERREFLRKAAPAMAFRAEAAVADAAVAPPPVAAAAPLGAAVPQAEQPADGKDEKARQNEDRGLKLAEAAGEPPVADIAEGQAAPDAPAAILADEVIAEPLSKERQQLGQALEEQEKKQDANALLRADSRRRVIRNDYVTVRVYAHQVRPNRQPGERVDFAETLFWHAGVKTDAKTGTATVDFGMNDSVTSFRVAADAFDAGGALGSGTQQIESVEPFYLEPKIPLAVTAGDTIRLPIGFVNATRTNLTGVSAQVTGHQALGMSGGIAPLTVEADARVRRMLEIAVQPYTGDADLTITAKAGSFADKVTRHVRIEPRGFPIEEGRGGLLAAKGEANHDITVPDSLVAGSVKARVAVYPTPLSSMNDALARLIVEPCGCFEQTSSTNYPLVMAQQYFMSHEGVDPSLIQASSKALANGYDRLLSFECKSGGYEWFGEDPGHEALTAYGLMEFSDMSKVHSVDSVMLERTRKWLLGTKDGKGGFNRGRRALHTWITEPECSNGYIAWALLQTGSKEGLDKELKWVRAAAERDLNTYSIALAANVLALGGDHEGANHLLDKLSAKQQPDGSLTGATTSIVGSGGEALTIEATSLAVLAWLTNPRYADNVEKSIKYLAEVCKGGRFGSTQSTVLALKAIVAYDASRAVPKAPGSVQLVVDGKEIGKPVPFDVKTHGAIELPEFAAQMTPGKHKVAVRMADGSQMPYSMTVTYHSLKPDTSKDCKLNLEVKLRDTKLGEGAATEAVVAVVNTSNDAVPNPVAIIGIPGGLEVRHDQLKELVKAGKIAAYEVRGRDVVLYWRSLKGEERVELPVSLIAAVPGNYTGPASRAYLYYTDEHKQWVDGLAVEIEAKR